MLETRKTVLRECFFINNTNWTNISSNIELTPIHFSFSIYSMYFDYFYEKKRFKCLQNQFPEHISNIANNNYINYEYLQIIKKGMCSDYKIIIQCNDPIEFLNDCKRYFGNEVKLLVFYKSPNYLENTNYTKDFFINNIKKTRISGDYYCAIELENKTCDIDSKLVNIYNNEYINICFSGHKINIRGNIHKNNELLEKFRIITNNNLILQSNINNFYIFNESNYPITNYNEINELFNSVLEYFSDFYIKYINIGYHYDK